MSQPSLSRRNFLNSTLGLVSLSSFLPRSLSADGRPSGWIKSPHNPVLSLGDDGNFDSQNIFAPAVAKHAGRYFLFYAGGPSGPAIGGEFVRYQLGLALSEDGIHFKKTGQPLLPLGMRDNFHATPALLRTPEGGLDLSGGKWQMVYCGNRADDIEYATSKDGLTWVKDPRSPIFRSAYAPTLIRTPDEVRMYYVHKPPERDGRTHPWEIHLATGRELTSLEPHPDNPILRISQDWERRALFYPYVLRHGGAWAMFYAAYWTPGPAGEQRTAIGTAASDDGIHWTKSPRNPVLTPTPGSPYDSRYASSQAVIRDGDHWKMYYASRIDMQHKYFAIGLATRRGPHLDAP